MQKETGAGYPTPVSLGQGKPKCGQSLPLTGKNEKENTKRRKFPLCKNKITLRK